MDVSPTSASDPDAERSRSRSRGRGPVAELFNAPHSAPDGLDVRAALFQVVLLVDISGSMSLPCEGTAGSRQSRIEAVFDAVESFAETLSSMPDVVCSLVLFNDTSEVAISREPTQGDGLRAELEALRLMVRPSGGGSYRKALRAFREMCCGDGVTIGVLLSDGMPSETLIHGNDAVIFDEMDDIRREFRERCKLHTLGFGRFDASCLRRLARSGDGTFLDNPTLDAAELRGAFQQISTHVSTLRTSVLTFGSAALVPLPPREMEEPEVWEKAPPSEWETLGNPHWAWLMLDDDGTSSSSSASPRPSCSDSAPTGGALKVVGEPRRVIYHKKPFAQGGLRYAFHLFLSPTEGKRDMHLVVKESKFKGTAGSPQEVHRLFLSTHRRAEAFAKAFNRSCKGIVADGGGSLAMASRCATKFVKAFVVQIDDPAVAGGFRFVTAENYIPGRYVKFSDNNGWVNELAESGPAEVAGAFSHFTFDQTEGAELCVDIQGVGLSWTDPQLHSQERVYGPADHGADGMRRFFATHVCSKLCCELRLRAVNPQTIELGEVVKEPGKKQTPTRVCMICMDKEREFVCRPCGHLCYCRDCSAQGRTIPCPVCRGVVDALMPVRGKQSSTFIRPSAITAKSDGLRRLFHNMGAYD